MHPFDQLVHRRIGKFRLADVEDIIELYVGEIEDDEVAPALLVESDDLALVVRRRESPIFGALLALESGLFDDQPKTDRDDRDRHGNADSKCDDRAGTH